MSNLPVWEQGVRQGGMMNQEIMKRNLLDFKESMDKNNIPFVFIFGSLLGLIRENGLIAYDHDADVACLAEDHQKIYKVIDELKHQGFTVPDKNKCPIHDHFFIRDDEKIDLWWFEKVDTLRRYDYKVKYNASFIEQPEKRKWLNVEWNVPQNPEHFLELTYGASWKVPNPNGVYILK